jgi:5-methylcytosine-specific restriction protein A
VERSEEAKSWRWMYNTDLWRRLRSEQLLREPWCRECAKQGRRIRATDVDHIVDHKGDMARFSDAGNLESLCHSCHSRKTAAELWQNRAQNRRS